jgi:5'-nucleotidase (lipoprotein e(P4) family)
MLSRPDPTHPDSPHRDAPGTDRAHPDRRTALGLLLAGAAATVALPACARAEPTPRDALLWAVAWKQTAAEFRALCHQAYNLARMRLDAALAAHGPDARPLAVIADMDDTILHADSYWGHLVSRNMDFFDDPIWDEWIPRNQVTPVPGSLDFLHYATGQGVEVFYVTSREQGEGTFGYALEHLRLLGFPFADADHLTVFRDTSDKSSARERVAESFDIALLLGDNLNDFHRRYYVADVDERIRLMEEDRDRFGRDYIVFPNPTDGHWVRAIFGESEPPPTEENRRTLREAAQRVAWDGR